MSALIASRLHDARARGSIAQASAEEWAAAARVALREIPGEAWPVTIRRGYTTTELRVEDAAELVGQALINAAAAVADAS
jgi:hypothetical protein